MRNGSIDAQHKIGFRDDRRRVGEIRKLAADMHDIRLRAQDFRIAESQVALHADPLKILICEQRTKFFQRD